MGQEGGVRGLGGGVGQVRGAGKQHGQGEGGFPHASHAEVMQR